MIEKYKYQKYYFQYMDDEYPNLTFNNIEYKLISDYIYSIKAISYIVKDFNAYKKNFML